MLRDIPPGYDFKPTPLMPKRILAERNGDDVWVWYEGDDAVSIYKPTTPGYDKWTALADEQRAEALPWA